LSAALCEQAQKNRVKYTTLLKVSLTLKLLIITDSKTNFCQFGNHNHSNTGIIYLVQGV